MESLGLTCRAFAALRSSPRQFMKLSRRAGQPNSGIYVQAVTAWIHFEVRAASFLGITTTCSRNCFVNSRILGHRLIDCRQELRRVRASVSQSIYHVRNSLRDGVILVHPGDFIDLLY